MNKSLLLTFLLTLVSLAGSNVRAVAQTTEPNEVIEIASPEDLNAFAAMVENGAQVDGLLTADIDLRVSDFPNQMIGTESYPFTGKFDGQGHTVYYSYDFRDNYCGLFSYIRGATICNLRVEGDVVTRGIHYGALIGYGDGEMLVENVVTDVTIVGEHSGVTGNGGMIGALYGNITFNNCATLGEMGNPGSSMYCGFVAFATGGVTSTLNNCFTACKLTEGTGTDYCFTFCRGTYVANNCYYVNAIGEVQGTQVTEEQVASGSLCYKLNGDQSNISWTQTLGKDRIPQPGTGSLRVYASGTVRCDGAELEDNPLTYTNTESYPDKPDHKYSTDGICTVCGLTDPNAVKQNEEGFYLIENAEQMYWLNLKVQEGATDLKVLLTDDIDLNDGFDPDLMIGTESRPFKGIFDGGGHTITYDYTAVTSKWRGLFAFIRDATIRNLRVEGAAYVTQIHYGALMGRADGTILVENVVTNVNITGAMNQVTGDAGMVGANYANITFNNCATLGKLGYPGSSMYSGFSGYSSSSSSATLNNCYTISQLTEETGTGSCFTFIHGSGAKTFNNCYYLNAIGTVQGTAITEEEVANGSLAAKLGAGWYQNIGEDAYPVLDKTHATVKEITEAGYATMYIPNAVEIPADVEVYTGSFEETWLKLNAVEGTVPAWEPVVLKGAPGIYSFMPAAASETSTEVVFADLGFENAADLTTFNVGGLTFSFSDGGNTNTPKYYTSGSAARIYAKNSMTISAAAPISKIEFTFGTNYAFKSGGYELSNGTYALATKTWTGNAQSITFKNTGTSQWRIVSMTITYEGTAANIAGNVLKGAKEDTEAAGKYILAMPEGEPVGFYLAETGKIKAGKAYLEVPEGTDVKAFYFYEDEATGIDSLDGQRSMVNGQSIYNLAGQRLQKMQRGINIVGGKKILK